MDDPAPTRHPGRVHDPTRPAVTPLTPGPASVPPAGRARDRWRTTFARTALAAALAVHLVVLYWPTPGEGQSLPFVDKVVHVTVFAAVAVAGRWAGASPWLLGGALTGHAVVSEVVQHTLLPGRTGDPWDVAANLAGTLLGLGVARWVEHGHGGRRRDPARGMMGP